MEQRLEMSGGGSLICYQDGPRVRLEAERAEDGRGLYKIWLRGSPGGRLLLGTLAPERGKLRLTRTLSLAELERAGCWPVVQAEAALAFPFHPQPRWYCDHTPHRLLSDSVLRDEASCPMLCRRTEGGGFLLAAPFRPSAPIPLVSLICLARFERLEGESCLVWAFDREGMPIPPHKSPASGQTELSNGASPDEQEDTTCPISPPKN